MDTKSSGWKAVVSFLCFFLGGVLLLVSIVLGITMTAEYEWQQVSDVFQDDYQNTRQFETTIARTFQSLLSNAELGNKAEGYNSVFVLDPNLPCEVWVDGKREYSSNNTMFLNTGAPEGYNFYLHFDGKSVTAIKDGKEVDLYQEGHRWDMPNTLNMPSQSGKKIGIYLAAPAEPARYPGQYSVLYNIPQDQARNRGLVLLVCAIPAAGLLFFIIYIVMNKHKKRADMALARGTGRIWAEFKLPVALILLWFIFKFPLVGNIGYYLRVIAAPILLLFFLYFLINDLRYNGWHGVLRQSLCGTVIHAWNCEELKRPVERRLQRRAVAVFAAVVPLALMSMAWGYFDLFRWAWFGTTNRQGMFVFVPMALLGLLCLLAQIYFLKQNIADAHLVNEGMEEVINQRMKSERMKVELVANVSHDLKTPLTSIVSYVELLSREEGLPDHVNDYIKILGEKSERLKTMVQEVFEVSKAASGDLPLDMDEIDLCKLIRQTLADMEEPIGRSGLTLREQIPPVSMPIRADGNRMYRVFQNLMQNALQYSLEGSRIYVALESDGDVAVATVCNTSRDELPTGLDFTARFVRGDESRTDGGSGLGLSIARTFTEACGGKFRIDTAADLFTATVEFPLAK